jgi:hypothetical protein
VGLLAGLDLRMTAGETANLTGNLTHRSPTVKSATLPKALYRSIVPITQVATTRMTYLYRFAIATALRFAASQAQR